MFSCNNVTGNGFHLVFENGWTVSVQWGDGTYSAGRDGRGNFVTSPDAEVAAWDKDSNWWKFEGDTVQGYKSASEVVAFANMIASL